MKKLLLLLVAVAFAFAACQGGLDNEDNGGTPSTPKIELSQQFIDVGFEAATYSVSVTSPYSWKAVSDNDWIVVESETGIAGTEELSFKVELNEKEKERKGTILLINSTYNLAAELYVIQKGVSAESKNVMLYTSSDGSIVKPYETSAFGANIVSNTYHNGQGVIIFDAPVTSIGEDAFRGCTSLTSVTIPDSVTSIGDRAFQDCTSLKAFYGKFASSDNRCLIIDGVLNSFAPASLTQYTIPDSVTSIGELAFFYCTSLTSVTIPDSVTSIGDRAFQDCTSLKAFYGKFASSDNRCLIIDGVLNSFAPASLTQYTIPDSVTSIGELAFFYCTSLTSVTIPDSVTSIGDSAFYNCTSLTSITIPNSVTSIGGSAFSGCTGELIINSKIVETDYPYNNYPSEYGWLIGSKFTKLTIGDSITSIGDYAFYECRSLTSVTIPDSVTSIGDSAFSGCASLKAFYGKFASSDNRCLIVGGVLNSFAPAGLTEYTIPDSVTSIGKWAFLECTSLTSITIPDSVTSIGYGAFRECTSLTSIYCKPTTPPLGGSDIFSHYNGYFYKPIDCKIYVPTSSVGAYKSARYWSDYASSIEGHDF